MPSLLRQTTLDGRMGHELPEVEACLHAFAPDRFVRAVDLAEQIADRTVERAVGFELVVARLEQRSVGCRIVAGVFGVEGDAPSDTRTGGPPVSPIVRVTNASVDVLDERVEALVLIVDVEPGERLARRRHRPCGDRPPSRGSRASATCPATGCRARATSGPGSAGRSCSG